MILSNGNKKTKAKNTKNAGKSAVPRERQTKTKAKLLNAYKYL